MYSTSLRGCPSTAAIMDPAPKRIKLDQEPNPQRLSSLELSFKERVGGQPHCQCIAVPRDKARLRDHNAKYHFDEFVCKVCDRGFQQRNHLQQHNRTHGHKMIPCPGCETSFETRSAMMQHLECDCCQTKMKSRHIKEAVQKLEHCKTFLEDSTLKYKCPGCDKKFIHLHLLFSHLENRRYDVRNWLEETKVDDLLFAMEYPDNSGKKIKFVKYQCRYCRFYTWSEEACGDHIFHRHTKQFYTWCEPCQKQCESHKDYYQHLLDTPQHFPCTFCGEKDLEHQIWTTPIFQDFGSQEALDAHTKEKEHRICVPCNKPFIHRILLETHEEKFHEPVWPSICKSCDQAFPDEATLKKHQATHGDTPIGCLGCTERFGCYSLMFNHLETGKCNSKTGQKTLKMHVSNIYARHAQFDEINKYMYLDYKCPKCREEFPSMTLLFNHLETRACPLRRWKDFTEVNKLLFEPLKQTLWANRSCIECNKSFNDSEQRNEHMRDHHESTFCFMCNRHFSSKDSLAFHMRGFKHNDKYGCIEQRRCIECESKPIFNSEWALYDHSRKEHQCCEVCSWVFDHKEDLIKHDKECHLICDECHKFCDSEWELFKHLREHNKKVPVEPTWKGFGRAAPAQGSPAPNSGEASSTPRESRSTLESSTKAPSHIKGQRADHTVFNKGVTFEMGFGNGESW